MGLESAYTTASHCTHKLHSHSARIPSFAHPWILPPLSLPHLVFLSHCTLHHRILGSASGPPPPLLRFTCSPHSARMRTALLQAARRTLLGYSFTLHWILLNLITLPDLWMIQVAHCTAPAPARLHTTLQLPCLGSYHLSPIPDGHGYSSVHGVH